MQRARHENAATVLVDPVVLHSAPDGGFDAGCDAAASATDAEGQGRLTPDAYVYTRSRQDWTVRRLYRPTEAVPYFADQNADGVLEDYRKTPAIPIPSGHFAAEGITVLPGSGRSAQKGCGKGGGWPGPSPTHPVPAGGASGAAATAAGGAGG